MLKSLNSSVAYSSFCPVLPQNCHLIQQACWLSFHSLQSVFKRFTEHNVVIFWHLLQPSFKSVGRIYLNFVVGNNFVDIFVICVCRRKKYVVVNGSFLVPYDHLVLCTGTQYQLPRPTGLDIANGATNNDIPTPHLPQQRFEGRPPVNAFTVNDSYDAAVVLYWIENNVFDKEGLLLLGFCFVCCN